MCLRTPTRVRNASSLSWNGELDVNGAPNYIYLEWEHLEYLEFKHCLQEYLDWEYHGWVVVGPVADLKLDLVMDSSLVVDWSPSKSTKYAKEVHTEHTALENFVDSSSVIWEFAICRHLFRLCRTFRKTLITLSNFLIVSKPLTNLDYNFSFSISEKRLLLQSCCFCQ